MGKRSSKVDEYIAKSAEFARPILTRLRDQFHKACPEIEEELKWSAPCFYYKGIVAMMAAFKHHIRFGFWKGKLLEKHDKRFAALGVPKMGEMLFTDVAQLPPDKVLLQCIRGAVELNEQGIKAPMSARKGPKKDLEIPDYFLAALKKNKKALAVFEVFSPSHKREYIAWLTEAKQEETRKRRLATALEWIAQGKPRNWKYMNC